MKNLVIIVAALSNSMAWSQGLQSRASPPAQTEIKVKAKGAKVILRDKSKPVRKAIEEWYGRNIEAFNAKDVAAVMALRTDPAAPTLSSELFLCVLLSAYNEPKIL